MKLCLNMIVKNESARIERALASVAQFIDSWVIVDTGSTDDTKDKIVAFFKAHGIKGEIRDEPFEDWSQARNAALKWGRDLAWVYEPDYFLLMDADMELVVTDAVTFLADRAGASYEMYQRAGALHYTNSRLVKASETGVYRGVTHEYLDIPTAGKIGDDVAFFLDHADGANRPEKFKRDIRLLRADLKRDPNNARSFFYLAQSYRDAGNPEKAAIWFKRRVDAGGWSEEVWQAQLNRAHCLNAMGDEAGFIREALVAYNMRPTRAESMYDLAHHYRHKGMSAAALACAEAVEHLPPSEDSLFVNKFVYQAGIQEEISISAFYVPGKRHKGLVATDRLSMLNEDYWSAISCARGNMYHYLEPLSSLCPSFQWKRINFEPPQDWVAMNPSVCLHHDALHVNVRCVNYRINEHGQYLIKASDGTANAENPINTRNFMLYLGHDPFTETIPTQAECTHDLPVVWPLVIGFEDMRIWSKHGQIWSSATVRQLHEDGNCEQVLSRLQPWHEWIHVDVHRMLRTPRETEKNWSPILASGPQRFMWRPGTVVDTDGKVVSHNPPGIRVDNLSGSSQVIPWKSGYIAVLHTAHAIPGSHLRHYYHRFITYDADFKVKHVSLPFYFNERGIEFCAGLCAHPYKNELVLSYGFQDKEARIATVSCNEVETLLWATSRQ